MNTAELEWHAPPQDLRLPQDEIHVWRVPLDEPGTPVQALHQLLSGDEQQRAARFHFDHDRRRFIVARGVLRTLLGRYLGLAPGQVQFAYNPQGKPALAEYWQPSGLHFNVSHAGELALYAFTLHRLVGIDVERIRNDIEYLSIAARFFSAQENTALRSLPADLQLAAFFTGWTRKEAYLKATGMGLSLPLDQVSVALHPDEPAQLLSTPASPTGEFVPWSLHALTPRAGYVAALAVVGPIGRLTCWAYPAESS
jgi:4'-phosphopantetheinyl transferase